VLSSLPRLVGLSEEDDDGDGVDTAAAAEGGGRAGATRDAAAPAAAGAAAAAAAGAAPGAAVYRLPLYLEDWVEQVMERLFALLANLDTGPSHRSTDQQAKPEVLVQSTHLGKVRSVCVEDVCACARACVCVCGARGGGRRREHGLVFDAPGWAHPRMPAPVRRPT
jgi:hypothetical protein